jgi:nucleotide-binding universal stress UspA family protein
VDLVIVGWRPVEGVGLAEQILQLGDHHLLLATHPSARLEKALVCSASGEPGKDDVLFAGRLLRHVGAQAKLFTVVNGVQSPEYQRQHVERFIAGGKHSLERFGVPTESEIRLGHPQTEISEEMQKGEFDLVVLGAPLPNRDGRVAMTKVVEGVMKNADHCSILMVRSHSYRT